MVLSQTAEYALRAVLFLAGPASGRTASVEEIAGALDIPSSYLSKILQQLQRATIVAAWRGRSGGYRLAVAADRLRLARILNVFEGDGAQRHCLLGRGPCSDRTACPAHSAWKETAEQAEQFFGRTSIADIQGPIEQVRAITA